MISSTNTVVNAMKPGTSRKLCRMPISMPVKAARSTAKLLSSADQALKATGTAMLISTSSMMGVRQLCRDTGCSRARQRGIVACNAR